MLQRCFWYHVIHRNFCRLCQVETRWCPSKYCSPSRELQRFGRCAGSRVLRQLLGSLDWEICWIHAADAYGLAFIDFPSQIVPRQLQNASFTAMNFKQLRKGLSSTKTPFFQPLLSLYDTEQVELSWIDLCLPTLLWQVSPSMTWLSSATKLRSSCLSQGPFLCGKYDKLSGWAKIKPDWWSRKD